MTDQLGRVAPPGWYEDPEAADLLRWWDGTEWSDDAFRPKPSGGPNPAAERARRLFFWALGVVVLFWVVPITLTFIPAYEAQTLGVILFWIGGLPGMVLIVLAVVFGAIGLHRSRALGGEGRTSALTGLVGGISLLAAPALLGMIVMVVIVLVNL